MNDTPSPKNGPVKGNTAQSILDRLKNIEVPHPLVIIFIIVLFAALATYIIPGGEYGRVEKDGRSIVVAGSFHQIPHRPQGIFELSLVPFNGMMQAADIIILLFIIGGAFSIIKDTGALTAGIYKVTQKMKGKEIIMIPILMSIFALGGGVFGMYEEVLPFVGIVVPMAIAMGYDSIVGVSMVYLGTVLGFCGAFFNPFTVGIAQGVAGLPLFSGFEYRMFVWAVVVSTGIIYVMVYASKIKKNPELSETFASDRATMANYGNETENKAFQLTSRHIYIILILLTGFAFLPVGVVKWRWGIKELTGLFFSLGIISGLVGGRGFNKVTESFIKGAGGDD